MIQVFNLLNIRLKYFFRMFSSRLMFGQGLLDNYQTILKVFMPKGTYAGNAVLSFYPLPPMLGQIYPLIFTSELNLDQGEKKKQLNSEPKCVREQVTNCLQLKKRGMNYCWINFLISIQLGRNQLRRHGLKLSGNSSEYEVLISRVKKLVAFKFSSNTSLW